LDSVATIPDRRDYGKPSRTLRGELVKSQAEKQIADYFYINKIKYSYESQAKTDLSAFRDNISKPDFFLPDYNVYVEFWGLIDVSNPVLRNKYKEDMRWKKGHYYKNHLKFISLYPWHLNDIDGAFRAQFKLTMGKDLITGPVGEKSVYALSISIRFRDSLLNGLPDGVGPPKLDLLYAPYYFVEYDSFTQGNFLYERVNLASKGLIVLEGQKGGVVDFAVHSGNIPTIAMSGGFIGCSTFQQVELGRSEIAEKGPFSKFNANPVNVTKGEAERLAQIEIAKNLSETFSRKLKNGTVSTKTLRPSQNNVRVVSIKLVNIPLISAYFTFKSRTYSRVLQATTNRLLADDFLYCTVGQRHQSNQAVLLCDECGNLACKDHGKNCASCGRALCANHVSSKGIVLKKYYCPDHVPV